MEEEIKEPINDLKEPQESVFKRIVKASFEQANEIFKYELSEEIIDNITERIFINVKNEIEKNETNCK